MMSSIFPNCDGFGLFASHIGLLNASVGGGSYTDSRGGWLLTSCVLRLVVKVYFGFQLTLSNARLENIPIVSPEDHKAFDVLML